MDGVILDNAKVNRIKNEYMNLLIEDMREQGYVVRIDVYPDVTTEFINDKEGFKIMVSIYGIHVGRKDAIKIDALDGYVPIYKQIDQLT